MEQSKYQKYIDLLEANKNLILTGAPGTGKSYMAKEIAKEMKAKVKFIQFHPSYDYTDFVEGLRPTPPDNKGNIGFERKDGVFKTFCKEAIKNIEIEYKRTTNHAIEEREVILNKNVDSFDIAYNRLLNDIKNGTATLYSDFRRSKMTPLKVKVTTDEKSEDKYIIRYFKTNGYQKANIIYLKKIYNYYLSKKIYDIRFEKDKDFVKIIGNTLDYSRYRGIVQGLLDRIPIENNLTHKEEAPIQKVETTNDTQKNTITKNNFVFIIDEINRGEISKILGELFFSIDPGYRGKKGVVQTQYQNMITDENDPFYEGFYVPENVYIIGTMNDIDRSVESMDFAMRRRFAWQEIKAEANTGMLDCLEELKDEAVAKMNCLNKTIWDEETNEGIEGLSPAYHIGGAYFSKLKDYLNDKKDNKEDAYKNLWQNHLHGVLFEYLRGTANATENMKKLKEAYDNN